MSTVKFDYPTYKLFEYHPQRPIIVDADAIESPDTVTLRYEEEAAARSNGGDLRGDSPPGLLSMSAYPKPQPQPGQMHAFDSSRSYPDPQYQYSAPHFNAGQQSENEAAQLNHMAFAANNAASQYMTPVIPTLISYQPSAGVFGTKVMVKISAAYDLIAVTSHFFLGFDSHKCPAHAIRDTSDASGYGYVVSADAPQLEDTRSGSASVPLSLFIETPEGQALANIEVGTFLYHDAQAGAGESPTDSVTRKGSKSPEHRPSPPRHEPAQLPDAAATNTFGYPQTASQAVAPGYDPSFATNGNMIGTYHRTSYATDYHPRPPPLKTSQWSPYASSLAAHRSSGLHGLGRHHLTALPPPTPSAPALVRTSTINQSGPTVSGQYNSYHMYTQKVHLKVVGDLQSMELGWTTEEWDNRRRIVMFSKKQVGTVLTTSFRPISVNERPPNSICISCIYWAEKDECYVTSVDTISLLEQLLTAPTKFTVEEKNRIRRNLEGFRPLTVSKAKPESEEFFKIIMAFGNPKPRNIEKDVKVFPWKILPQALKKIISKYVIRKPYNNIAPGAKPSSLAYPSLGGIAPFRVRHGIVHLDRVPYKPHALS
ncbi:putative transcriptional regulator medusa protein [Eutypa lata UCREL1]|uniref:Putative transcriptional regulator medusa protein n=1 Tax=Eutypa lata (strain UCR-EL1) TaxID=1287681 RepID=M7SWC7_EUTLA|nr:putative transcriptional regulator medusa protein [Eutypa lata UCREL1]